MLGRRVRHSTGIATTHPHLVWVVGLLLAASLACALPWATPTPSRTPVAPSPTPTITPTPTAIPPLPPTLVESDPPLANGVLPLAGPLTLFFSQPMERASVEAALTGKPPLSGRFVWRDDSTVSFHPDTLFPPQADILVTINTTARATNGLSLQEQVQLAFRTPGFLRLSQVLPDPEASDINPASAVVATFNQPIVPLGGDPVGQPPAFSLEPQAPGHGTWINTSTFVFYPDPPLHGGTAYTAHVNEDLISAAGAPLDPQAELRAWSFTTALPRLLAVDPLPKDGDLGLDATFTLTFNQPMDPQSVAANLSLLDPQGVAVPLTFDWSEDLSVLTLTPQNLLARDRNYRLRLAADARAQGGTTIGEPQTFDYHSVRPLAVIATDPPQGGVVASRRSVRITFSAPIRQDQIEEEIAINPAVSNLFHSWDPQERALLLYGFLDPGTDYALTFSADLEDLWGGRLGQDVTLRFRTAPAQPELTPVFSSTAIFLPPDDPRLPVRATNIASVNLSLGRVPLEDFIPLVGPQGYELLRAYRPQDRREWVQKLGLPSNQGQIVDLALNPDGQDLTPGLYLLTMNAPGLAFPPSPHLIVVSQSHLTFKTSALEALLWAVDLNSGQPRAQAHLSIYDESGMLAARGQTDSQGVLETPLPLREDPFAKLIAVLGEPGSPEFGLALSNWDAGIAPWNFAIPVDFSNPGEKTYLYSDRPIYRPGQVVHFRAVVRKAFNGRYTLPQDSQVEVRLMHSEEGELSSQTLVLSAFGTAHGEFTLPQDARPGTYRLETDSGMLRFQVADYRKPEIDLQVALTPAQVQAGQDLVGEVTARYFFGAPAGNLPVRWSLYSRPTRFEVPGYHVGVLDQDWYQPYWVGLFAALGTQVATGEAQTTPDGRLRLDLPTRQEEGAALYTLEVTIQDESGFPVSARAEVQVHPDRFYLGVRPQAWVGQAGEALGFEVQEVDWDQNPVPKRPLEATFERVVWERQDPVPGDPLPWPTFKPVPTLVAREEASGDGSGRRRFSFTPPEPGTYRFSVVDGQARTEVLIWVGGAAQAAWPALPNQQLRLTADQLRYQPGDQAQVFIPNPFASPARALVTIERGRVLRHQVVTLEGAGTNLSLPLEEEDAPNVYLTVTALGRDANGRPDFRVGYLNLEIEPHHLTLNVILVGQPQRPAPGDSVTLNLQVTDAAGNPIQGEFSLAVVDLATLALAEPQTPAILPAFYGQQPLGVRTGLALAAYARRTILTPGGMGGGGGEEPVIRETFLDTAYWNPTLVTDEDGFGQVTFELPDNLTTWQVLARGLTADTRVGEAEIRLVASKDLLVRPLTPRFLVVGDHLRLAAVVHNNTGARLPARVQLQAQGFVLDQPTLVAQEVSLEPGGQALVTWWGTVEDVPSVDLVFSAQAGEFQDAARPSQGEIPVLHYAVPHTFATAGILAEAGERLEVVAVPRSFEATGGELQLELAPSLAAAATQGLEALEAVPYGFTEMALSRFLPNLETYRTLKELGLDVPGLEARLNRTLAKGLERLETFQNEDGGWSWWPGDSQSDPLISAYVVFGLARARQAGVPMNPDMLEQGVGYLQATLPTPQMMTATWQYDRLAFQHFALAQADRGDLTAVVTLYDLRQGLSPWGQAMLALSLEALAPDDTRVRTMVAELQTSALRTGTGASWPVIEGGERNMFSGVSTSAVVVYALARLEPASPVLSEAVRYLMAARGRDGAWASSYETAWTLMALTEVMKGTGELAGDFTYAADLNGASLAEGTAGGAARLTPAQVAVPLEALRPGAPNELVIRRGDGAGRLYYRAYLQVERPVETIPPLAQGLAIERKYLRAGEVCAIQDCAALDSGSTGEQVVVRLTLVLENDAYHLLVEDHFPAGAEVLDRSLRTNQQGALQGSEGEALFDPQQPFEQGWGWWLFNEPQVYADRIVWAVDYLPAGTYELTYTLNLVQPGEYRVLPARGWQVYFPEVQGSSAGALFVVQP